MGLAIKTKTDAYYYPHFENFAGGGVLCLQLTGNILIKFYSLLKPTYLDSIWWMFEGIDYTQQRHILAEDYVLAPSSVFKITVEELLSKIYLDVQLG